MSLSFIIVSPPYTSRSAGIMVLHDLCTALNKLNYKAGIVFTTSGSQEKQDFTFGYSNEKNLLDPNGIYYDYISGKSTFEIDQFVKNSCVIYPDIIVGNPLGSKMYSTYVLGNPKTEIKSDFVITYFSIYTNNADHLLCKPFLSEDIHNRNAPHWTQRTLNLTYIGKGVNIPDSRALPGTVLVERNWPSDKHQLGVLLRNCKYFFTWDLSATNFDAVLCGAVPILMSKNYLPIETINSSEFGNFPNIKYDENFDFRATPNDINSIDDYLNNMIERLHHYNDSWVDQVSNLVVKLKNRYSYHN